MKVTDKDEPASLLTRGR